MTPLAIGVEPFRDGREHLAAELAWLDAALLALVRTMPRPADPGQGWYVSPGEVELLLAPDSRRPAPPAEVSAGLAAMRQDLHRRRAASHAVGVVLPLDRVAAAFGLGPVEELLIVACLAREVDAVYGKVFGFLHDDLTRSSVSRDLMHRLVGLDPAEAADSAVLFDPSAPVFRWGIVTGAAGELVLDPEITGVLLGRTTSGMPPGRGPSPTVGLMMPDSVVAALYREPIEELVQLLRRSSATVVRFDGPGSDDGEAVFGEVCRRLGGGCERVQLDPSLPPEVTRDQLRAVPRRAALTGSGVFLVGVDDVLADPRIRAVVLGLDGEILGGARLTGMVGGAGWPVPSGAALLPVRLELPTHAERTLAWLRLAPHLPGPDAAKLAAGAVSTTSEMAAAVRLAGLLNDDGQGEPGRADIEAARRIRGRGETAVGCTVVVPRAGWDDLVLPPEVTAHLREFCAQIRHRARVGHDWGLWRRASLGRGLAALLLGPSGTGKTLAAEVMAGEVGLDLMKIDLSAVVSKYIGETEKNLGRVFDAAARRGAILFFDEADALFGKRSEVSSAHDRYANIEVGYLLQRLEEFDGVVVLATNLPRNIDDAFQRRVRVSVEFPFPDEAARLRIWQAHLPPELPRDDDVDLLALARECKVAGGVISKIVWNAACLAADEGDRLRMAHLRHAMHREYHRIGKPTRG